MLSKKRKTRAEIFRELNDFNEKLIVNLRYEQRPLKDVLKDFPLIQSLFDGKLEIDKKDSEVIKGYFDVLGKSDSLSQVDFLSSRRESLIALSKSSEEDYRRYGSLYLKIFFMVGILVAVLLA